jgi:hypothetical protein
MRVGDISPVATCASPKRSSARRSLEPEEANPLHGFVIFDNAACAISDGRAHRLAAARHTSPAFHSSFNEALTRLITLAGAAGLENTGGKAAGGGGSSATGDAGDAVDAGTSGTSDGGAPTTGGRSGSQHGRRARASRCTELRAALSAPRPLTQKINSEKPRNWERGLSDRASMSTSTLKSFWISSVVLALGTGCSGGDGPSDDEASLDYVKPYATECTQTVCQKQAAACRNLEKQRCDDCFDSCSSPYSSDPALCASICHDICSDSDCNSCSAPKDQCAAEGVRFDPPPFNPELQGLAFSESKLCEPASSTDEISRWVNFVGRSFRHDYAAVLECVLAKGCDAFKECDTFPSNGSVGTELYARQRACGAPRTDLGDSTATYVDSLEPVLRPALVAELARCAREADCAAVAGCWAALQPALGLADYP